MNNLSPKDVAIYAAGVGGSIALGIGIAAAGGALATSAVVLGTAASIGVLAFSGYKYWSAGVDRKYALSTGQTKEAGIASEQQSRALVSGLATGISSIFAGSVVAKLFRLKGASSSSSKDQYKGASQPNDRPSSPRPEPGSNRAPEQAPDSSTLQDPSQIEKLAAELNKIQLD